MSGGITVCLRPVVCHRQNLTGANDGSADGHFATGCCPLGFPERNAHPGGELFRRRCAAHHDLGGKHREEESRNPPENEYTREDSNL